jgi:hypothetical protein
MSRLTRRDALVAVGSAGLASGATWLGLHLPRAHGQSQAATPLVDGGAAATALPKGIETLRAAEYLTLVAASERIFPRDESPGAEDLGVAAYVDAALSDDDEPRWAEGFREGLARFDAACKERFAVPYHLARVADQESLIAEWAEGTDAANAHFVHQLIVATLEGALSDPIHHGNAGGRGWAAVGLRPDPYSPSEVRL